MTASRLAAFVVFLLLPPQQTARPDVRTVAAALDAFERGGWRDGDAPVLEPEALLATLDALKATVPVWVAATGPEQERRRRLVVAASVLHLLRSQEDPYLWQGGGSPFRYRRPLPAVRLLEWACELLRAGPPLAAERWWHLGAVALLERHNAQQALVLHLDHARARFPSEDRWTLARAVAEELRTWPEARDDVGLLLTPALTSAIVGRFEEAALRPSVRDEAMIRLGYFDLRRNHIDSALARFEQAGAPKERALRYWLALFRGHALERAKRPDEAIASYRAALLEAPFAQSAVLALAAALTKGHRGAEAAALVSRAIRSHARLSSSHSAAPSTTSAPAIC